MKFDNSHFLSKALKILQNFCWQKKGRIKKTRFHHSWPKTWNSICLINSFSHPLTWLDVEAAEKMVWRRKLPYQSLFSLSLSSVLIYSYWNISQFLEENGFVWNRSKIMFAKNCQVLLFEDSSEEKKYLRITRIYN